MASGPRINVFDQSCTAVESADSPWRQMGVLRIDHPMKDSSPPSARPGRWNNFNVSVGVSEVHRSRSGRWPVGAARAGARPAGAKAPTSALMGCGCTPPCLRASCGTINEIGLRLCRPGILFWAHQRDNNLTIAKTLPPPTPCGEQPLPSYGCCDPQGPSSSRVLYATLSGVVVPQRLTLTRLTQAVALQVRALDNVLDVTWPLPQQLTRPWPKRRIGVGFTGMGNTLAIALQLR